MLALRCLLVRVSSWTRTCTGDLVNVWLLNEGCDDCGQGPTTLAVVGELDPGPDIAAFWEVRGRIATSVRGEIAWPFRMDFGAHVDEREEAPGGGTVLTARSMAEWDAYRVAQDAAIALERERLTARLQAELGAVGLEDYLRLKGHMVIVPRMVT